MLTQPAALPASHAGLRIAAAMGGALVLLLALLALVRPEMMDMASLAKAVGIGWWPS